MGASQPLLSEDPSLAWEANIQAAMYKSHHGWGSVGDFISLIHTFFRGVCVHVHITRD